MIVVRDATEQDAAAIAHVHVESWRTTYVGLVPDDYLAQMNEAERVPLWKQWIASGIHVYVAEVDGSIVGFASGGAARDAIAECDSELFAIYVLRQAQRGGLGKQLVRTVAHGLKEDGFRSLMAWVLDGNSSVPFYLRLGALPVISKDIEVGGQVYKETAFVWPNLERLFEL